MLKKQKKKKLISNPVTFDAQRGTVTEFSSEFNSHAL
jgi:hypothetical protein